MQARLSLERAADLNEWSQWWRAATQADPEIVTISWGENALLEQVTQPPHGVSTEVVDVLIRSGAELDRTLNLAACWILADLCQQLLSAGADPLQSTSINEAFVFAAANGRSDVSEYLLSAGADVDARPYLNTTALHLAILFHNPDAVADLLERGASTELADDRYHSAASGWAQACRGDNPASVRVAELVGS